MAVSSSTESQKKRDLFQTGAWTDLTRVNGRQTLCGICCSSFVVQGNETVLQAHQELLCKYGKRQLNWHQAVSTEEEGTVGGSHPGPRPTLPGGRRPQLGRWGLRGAALPPSSTPTDPLAAGGPRGGGGSRALWPRCARRGLAGRGRATAARRSAARGPPGRPACERSSGHPRLLLAGPFPGRRGRRAAAAGRRPQAGRAAAGRGRRLRVQGPRAGVAGFQAEPPRPLPCRPGGRLCAPRRDSVCGVGLRRTKPQSADLGEIQRRPRVGGLGTPGPRKTLGRIQVAPLYAGYCARRFSVLVSCKTPCASSKGVMGGVPHSEADVRASRPCPPDLGNAPLLRAFGRCFCKRGGGWGVRGVIPTYPSLLL